MKHLVLDIPEIHLTSINKKYTLSKGKFVLNNEYRQLKESLFLACRKIDILPPYRVEIYQETALDIDNCVKLILDALAKTISNDKDIEELFVKKKKIKRGKVGRLSVWVESIS